MKQMRGKAKEIEYQGKRYEAIKLLAQEYDVNYNRLCKLLRKGWSIEEAMTIYREKVYGIGKLYKYKGKSYRSPKRLAERIWFAIKFVCPFFRPL